MGSLNGGMRSMFSTESRLIVAAFLPAGIGLAIGLSYLPGWGILVIIVAFLSSGAHIALRSSNYRNYALNLVQRGGGVTVGSVLMYFLLKTISEAVKIGLAAIIGLVVRIVLSLAKGVAP